jgi:hypothetical protein
MIVTRCPSFSSASALQAPTMPHPMTAMCFGAVFGILVS